MFGFGRRCMFGVQPDLTLSLVGPCNRATVRYFHRFPCRSRLLRTLARSRVGSFDKMLDAAAALGFATAMGVSGVNIVGIEQQRDFARRGQLRWPRASHPPLAGSREFFKLSKSDRKLSPEIVVQQTNTFHLLLILLDKSAESVKSLRIQWHCKCSKSARAGAQSKWPLTRIKATERATSAHARLSLRRASYSYMRILIRSGCWADLLRG
jgi:hypothetical protein